MKNMKNRKKKIFMSLGAVIVLTVLVGFAIVFTRDFSESADTGNPVSVESEGIEESDNNQVPQPETVTYTVNNNIIGNVTVTGNGTATHGDTYIATVSSDTGFSIAVTMNGQEVADAYSKTSFTSGTVTVDNVTGNIEITVTAANNLSDTSEAAGWKDGYRISSSAKDTVATAGWTVTNYFAVRNGDTVYVKNLDLVNGLNSALDNKLSAYYSDTDTFIVGFNLLYGADESRKYVADLDYSTDWQRFTVNYAGVNYMRLCGQLAANREDVIIIIERGGKWVTSDISVEDGDTTGTTAPKVLYTIGDSITNGKNGSTDENTERWTVNSGWVKYVMEENGYDTVNSKNLGVSSIGFNTQSNYDSLYIRDVIECSDAVKTGATVESKWGIYSLADADIIIVALGINDWKNTILAHSYTGTNTVEDYFSEMKYCLDRIREINPICKICYVMPFNIILGDKATDYALNYRGVSNDKSICYGNTLGEFKQMIRDKFAAGEFGDVKLIDIEPFAADEIADYLPDNIHPNAAGYERIGRELAAALRKLEAEN